MQGEEKKGKVKKGWLAVRVGAEGGDDSGSRRFVIPIAYLYHPLFRRLLEAARDAYGYDYSAGPLRLPCSVDEFLRLRALIERETQAAAGGSASSSSHRVHAGGGHHHHSLSPCTRAKVSS
ncbi:auxin-induced protein 15A-like [Phragmites australis]|uniref:auxin-induced protein 15A-like n=1 Tax=Phragmites australis TaxID=29695 RepID=UPI002D76E022|nr:auxin-induced protein 15A-like [Phragmites australis]